MSEGIYTAYALLDEDANLFSLDLKIDGAHCAACIQKIESALNREDQVTYARLNFSTKRLHVEWSGSASYAETIATIIEDLGYKVQVFDTGLVASDSDEENKGLLVRVGVSGFAAGNIMLLSFALWTTTSEIMGMATRDFMHFVTALIALPTVAYTAQPFFKSATGALRNGHTNMDVPISLAILLACGMSLHETFRHGEHVYFDSAVMLIFFLLIGRYLDSKARFNARSNATKLMSMLSGTATVLEDGARKIIPIRDVREGMVISVPAGQKIPADAIIVDGQSNVDTALVTGETLPRAVAKGDLIYAGTLNIDAPLTAEVSKATNDSLLSDIIRLIEKAEQSQAQYVRLADKAAALYTPIVHLLALSAFIGWFLIGGMVWQDALMISVTVLIITCPCALGLAVPVVQILATTSLMKRGILVKSGDALERLSRVDSFFFDKTGTLTEGHPKLLDADSYDPSVFKIAASMASKSHHPLSRALCDAYSGATSDMEVKEIPNKGLMSGSYKLGSRSWCGQSDAPIRDDQLELWLCKDDQEPIAFYFADQVRSDAKGVLSRLGDRGLSVSMLSGDRQVAARKIGDLLGIADVHAELSPTDKFDLLQVHKSDGRKVAMVGDGLNDAPVLSGADVSLSPSSAIDLAQNSADIIFNGSNLKPVLTSYDTACVTQRLVKQNFGLAVLYNLLAVPLALAGMVTPMIAAIAMSSSSLIVIANSYRLQRIMKDL